MMKSKWNVMLLLLVVNLMAFTNATVAQKGIELKYQLEQDDRFTNVSNIEQITQFEAMGQKVTLDQEMDFYLESVIDSVKNEQITQRITFKRIVMDQRIFGMEIKYDSEDSSTFNSPMGTEFATQMNKLINASVIAVMDNRGHIIEMDMSSLGTAGETSRTLNTGNNYAVYPDHKIKVGESWEEDLKPVKAGNMAVKIKYTLKKATRKEAVLEVDGVLSANVDNAEAGGELDGTMTGEMIVDRKTGMVKLSSLQLDMTMEVEQNGIKFPATTSSFIDTKIEKVK